MEVKAKLKYYRIAPRKARLVIDVIRGLGVNNAINQLKNLDKKSAPVILKLLNSAISNAVNNFSLKKDNLYIKEIRVDQGPALKRWMARAHGRGARILKGTSHITIILDEKNPSKNVAKKLKTNRAKTEKIEHKEVVKGDGLQLKKITKSHLRENKKTYNKKNFGLGQKTKSLRKTGDK